jgi:hypothetical protein
MLPKSRRTFVVRLGSEFEHSLLFISNSYTSTSQLQHFLVRKNQQHIMSSHTIGPSSPAGSRGPIPIDSSAVHGSAMRVNYAPNFGALPNRSRHAVYAVDSQYSAPNTLLLDQHCPKSTPPPPPRTSRPSGVEIPFSK